MSTEDKTAVEYDRLSLIREIEELKATLTRYETEVLPYAERQLTALREEYANKYNLSDEQKAVMLDRLQGVNTEESMQAKAQEVAVQLKAEGKPLYGEAKLAYMPRTERRQIISNEQLGRNLAQKVLQKDKPKQTGKVVSRIDMSQMPAPAPVTQTQFNSKNSASILQRWRKKVFGNKVTVNSTQGKTYGR
ncbi:hypothetical protein [Priestia megaterium]|uniref:hypothetical protein n=1 Tax=Priestia megaterium TaxID=1404 RepID=UPI002E1F7547|nr:hypothetical protein [Priestia megaterium]